MKVLLEGRPGIGKTTVARRLVALLGAHGVRVAGFTTSEIREGGARVGFALEVIGGERAVLAHASIPGPPRVGRYGVDPSVMDRLAVPALGDPSDVVVIDELGTMELASAAFREAAEELFASDRRVLATVHAHRHAFTDPLKARFEVIQVTQANRDALPERLAARV